MVVLDIDQTASPAAAAAGDSAQYGSHYHHLAVYGAGGAGPQRCSHYLYHSMPHGGVGGCYAGVRPRYHHSAPIVVGVDGGVDCSGEPPHHCFRCHHLAEVVGSGGWPPQLSCYHNPSVQHLANITKCDYIGRMIMLIDQDNAWVLCHLNNRN